MVMTFFTEEEAKILLMVVKGLILHSSQETIQAITLKLLTMN